MFTICSQRQSLSPSQEQFTRDLQYAAESKKHYDVTIVQQSTQLPPDISLLFLLYLFAGRQEKCPFTSK
jgi:hypothetical protein